MPNDIRPEKFEKIIIDLSGRLGLVDRFFGDYPFSVTHPELSMYSSAGQYASGVVNPIAKYGYLSPSNNTAVTVASSIGGMITATEVDEQNSFVFLYGNDGTLRRTTSLTQNSITATTITISNTWGTDLEWYSVAGIRKLFFAYQNTNTASSNIGVWDTFGISGTSPNGTSRWLKYTNLTGAFTVGNTLTGGSSGATGVITTQNILTSTTGTFLLESIGGGSSGVFTGGETITDGSGGSAHANVTGASNSSVYTNFFSVEPSGATTIGASGNFVSQGNYLKMIVADNAFMYILDGSFVHKYDGTITGGAAGTLTTGVLEFPPQFTLTDGIDFRGRMWITLFRSDRNIYANATNTGIEENYCGVFIWDRITEGTSTEDYIPVTGVREIRAIVPFQGSPTIFTVSSRRNAEIRIWNGSQFKMVAELGAEAYPRFHDSIEVRGDMMVWLGNDGQWYAYGRLVLDSKNYLYQFGDMTPHITTSSSFNNGGAIILANDQESTSGGLNSSPEAYYLGLTDSSTSQILKWYPHAYSPNSTSQQAHTGNYFSPIKFLPKLSHTEFVTIFFPPVGTGGSTTLMNINLYVNQNTTAWNGSPITVTQNDAQRGYITIPFSQNGVNCIQIGITYPASTSISLIPTPSFALVEFLPTTKRY